MIPTEIIKKVRHIEIRTRGLVNDLFGGEYHSVFKGRGMSFSEVREYYPGDDIRLIDWNVTARSSLPHVKIFEEERELTVYLIIDISKSGDFGTLDKYKNEIAAEIAAVLGFSAIKNNDKVGLIMFTDKSCPYCQSWEVEVGALYPKTEVANQFPLVRVTAEETESEFFPFLDKVRGTPTFILEDTMIRGYVGLDYLKSEISRIRQIDK